MLRRLLPSALVAALTFVLLVLSLAFSVALLVPGALVKLLTPTATGRAWVTRNLLDPVAGDLWWGLNRAIFLLMHGPRTDVVIDGMLGRDKSWLLLCNHQSWADIPLLSDVLSRQVPFPRFFLKQQLKWVPLVGFTCWAFDMPFMRRHSREAIAANPALRTQDLEETRRACSKFRLLPVTVINFLEGTRFTPSKRDARKSPYRHLLAPKAAGMAFTLNAMGEQFAGVIDVTVCYVPSRYGPFWSFMSGEQRKVRVRTRLLPVPQELLQGDYHDDEVYRRRCQDWVNALWARKDTDIAALMANDPPLR